MSSIAITASKTITLSNRFKGDNINIETILIGRSQSYDYVSFLYFDIPSLNENAVITKAELIFFKQANFDKYNKCCIWVCPLVEYFSQLTTYSNQPKFDIFTQKKYCFNDNNAAILDITDIVYLWVDNKLANRGIKIYCKHNQEVLSFYSEKYKDKMMRPVIKIYYKIPKECNVKAHDNNSFKYTCECNFKYKTASVKQVKVIGTVEPNSIFNAVIELKVKRNKNGVVDTYSVADEYNNSISDKPLSIKKTYNIAIIPKTTNKDIFTVNFYGSYKNSFNIE